MVVELVLHGQTVSYMKLSVRWLLASVLFCPVQVRFVYILRDLHWDVGDAKVNQKSKHVCAKFLS